MSDDDITPVEDVAREFATWVRDNADALVRYRDEARSFEDAVAVHRELQRLLWDEGWTRWGWPRASGGRGGSVRHRAAVYEVLALADIGVPETFQILEVAGEAVQHFAPELAAELLPRLVSGADVWSLGLSEPEAGSDLASLRTRIAPAGDRYVVTGAKTWNGFGHLADYSFALCRDESAGEGRTALTMALVDLHATGASTRPIRAMTGRNEFAEVFFDDVEVPAERIIGGRGNGWNVIAYMMQFERGTYAWPRQSRLHRRLDDLLARYPRSMAAHPGRLGEAYLDLVALRLKCRESLRALATEGGPGPNASVDKLLVVRAETEITSLGHDVSFPDVELGEDPDAAMWRHDYVYARALSIFGGTNEIQKNIIAEKILGLPREGRR
jgi:alkylation response protein AidB-like acyl-CoA dehydrogenase